MEAEIIAASWRYVNDFLRDLCVRELCRVGFDVLVEVAAHALGLHHGLVLLGRHVGVIISRSRFLWVSAFELDSKRVDFWIVSNGFDLT